MSKSLIFFKNPALSLFCLYSPLTSCKKWGKSLEPFLRKLCYQPTNQPTNQTMLIWRPFQEYLQIKNFFQKSSPVTFLPLQSPKFMQKTRRILKAVSEKTALPTNQPMLIWRPICEYVQIINLFQKFGSVTFLSL